VAGYYWRLEGLDFATVHGAGHMVPMDKPESSYTLIFDWINKKGIWAEDEAAGKDEL